MDMATLVKAYYYEFASSWRYFGIITLCQQIDKLMHRHVMRCLGQVNPVKDNSLRLFSCPGLVCPRSTGSSPR